MSKSSIVYQYTVRGSMFVLRDDHEEGESLIMTNSSWEDVLT